MVSSGPPTMRKDYVTLEIHQHIVLYKLHNKVVFTNGVRQYRSAKKYVCKRY